jgi:hypothetical protein
MIIKEPMLVMVIYLLAGLLAIVIWKGLAELARLDYVRPSSGGEESLEGALRAGAREFDKYRDRVVIVQPRVTVGPYTSNGPALELIATVRNDTGRVIKGLEVRGTVIDHQGRPVSERVAVVIPTQQIAIEPYEEINARLLLESARPEATHTGARVAVTGLIFD